MVVKSVNSIEIEFAFVATKTRVDDEQAGGTNDKNKMMMSGYLQKEGSLGMGLFIHLRVICLCPLRCRTLF